WVELKRLFEPDNDDILWKLQRYMHDPLVWRLYDTCGVHHVSSVRGHDIFMLVEKEYPLTRGTLGLMMVARLLVEADSEMSRELLRKIFYQANRPRQEYDLWSMRMEQYLTFTDHALWEVIVNGDSVSPIASASSGAKAIPDEHLLKFHACKDAKSLCEAINNRFGGNKESKKMQKTILKQNYENFAASSQEGLDKTYDRFQKLINQLEIHGEVISHEDANLKLLRSLPSAWNNIALIMRNKSDLDTYIEHG
ncbi:hypothetical protein Tco_1256346, partial [Tanacetum coccineum]